MRPLRHLAILSTTALLSLGAANAGLAQGFSMGEAVDGTGAPAPEAPQVVAPAVEAPQVAAPQATSPHAGASLGEPVDAASTPSIMGEPVDPSMGVAAQQPPAMGQPVANDDYFGAPTGGITAVPDAAPIPTTTATGIVKSYNESTLNLVMANRTVYRLPADFVDPGLKNGTKVKIEWYADGSNRRAQTVTIIKQ